MRAMIRVMLPDTTDQEAIEVKQEIAKVVEKIDGAEVEITIMAK